MDNNDDQVRVVSPAGLEQILDWMMRHYNDRSKRHLDTFDRIEDAVSAWASDAECSQHGEIEMPANMTICKQIVRLRPDMHVQSRMILGSEPEV